MGKKLDKTMKTAKTATVNNRRTSNDFWFCLARVLTFFSWLAFFIAVIIAYFVAPETDYGVLRYHGIEVRRFWLTPLTGYLYLVIWFSAAGIYTAMLIDKYRSRRKSDDSHYNAYFLLGINMFWLSVILNHVLKTADILA